MHRRTQDVFVSLLERAGYGFGYSEEVVRPDEAQTPREAQPPVDPGAPQPPMGSSPWGEDNQPAHNPDWTGLFTTSTDRRLQVWHELEEGLVERWVPLKGRLLASTTRRCQSFTDNLRACAADLQALTDRPRAKWLQVRQTLHSPWGNWTRRRPESQPERQPASEPVRMPIQHDRNWKVLQRVSLDARQRSVADSQPAESDPPEDLRSRQVFADVWSISETAPVDTRAEAEAEVVVPTPLPAVERLRRMLESEVAPDPIADDQTR